MVKITEEWDLLLSEEFSSEWYKNLREFLKTEYYSKTIFPSMYDIFNGQAMGLSFSVPKGMDKPPSLVNIFKELKNETGMQTPNHGDLTGWAKQGVLLLNTALTVRAHQANSHKGIGWEKFTDSIIKKISDKKEGVVFLLWGGNARSKKSLIDNQNHLVLECAHPSPLSAYNGFFGCGHFIKTNEYLTSRGKTAIDWSAL